MKDILSNRKRLPLKAKIKLLMLSIRQNGLLYTSLVCLYVVVSSLAERVFELQTRLRHDRGLPGLNSVAANRLIWENWDWNANGEEWSLSNKWKDSMGQDILFPHLENAKDVLELGPGTGRWTPHLLERSQNYWGVDLSKTCVESCRARFANNPRVQFHQNDGQSIEFIGPESIDLIWSFDVFVHINSAQTQVYLKEFARVLRSGGTALIHHGTSGGREGGWRSDLTASKFDLMAEVAGLKVVERISTWIDSEGHKHRVGRYSDDQLVVLCFP